MMIDIKELNESMFGRRWIDEFLNEQKISDILTVDMESLEDDLVKICETIRNNNDNQTIVIYCGRKRKYNA